ncbi:MAG: 3-hydroxydecanoyl-[acyl-carrier-protein] dehydratase [Chloroflexi bacterium]|nr:3-hydroxydecanoyl-[acyl-carrier-protein] dehydratase [Chloroflexota bacterium]
MDLRHERSYYEPRPNSPHYRLSQDKLDFLDEVQIIEEGGRYGRGYLHAVGSISPNAWFFSRHFYQDPVMPGSLGVEAVLQALQAYALHNDLGRHLESPHFTPLSNQQTTWKYRGQLTPENDSFHLEVHLSDVDVVSNSVRLVGDASVWKDDIRIYEVKGIGVQVVG